MLWLSNRIGESARDQQLIVVDSILPAIGSVCLLSCIGVYGTFEMVRSWYNLDT